MLAWICKSNRLSLTQWQGATPESKQALIAAYLKQLNREGVK